MQYSVYWVTTRLVVGLLVVAWLLALNDPEVLSSAGLDTSPLAGSPALPLISGVSVLTGVLLSVWLAGRFLDRRPFADFGLHLSRGWWLDLLFGMALGALLMTSIFLAEWGFGWVTVTGTLRSVGTSLPFAVGLLFPIAVFLCAGVSEELLFRGYQLRNAAEGLNHPALGPRGAILLAWALTSVFFGLQHANSPNATLLSTSNIVLAGLMFGLAYVLTGEIAIPIGLHITWNLFEGNVFGFPVSGLGPIGATFVAPVQGGPGLWTGGVFGPEAGLLGALAMLVGIVLITLWVRVRRGEIAIYTPLAEPPKPPDPVVAGARGPAD